MKVNKLLITVPKDIAEMKHFFVQRIQLNIVINALQMLVKNVMLLISRMKIMIRV